MSEREFAELLVRAACAGVLVLMGILHASNGRGLGVQRLAAMFELSTAGYVIISSPVGYAHLGAATPVFQIMATFNSVLFWWLATALFDDDFRWKVWRFIPAVFLLATYIWRFVDPESAARILVHQTLIVLMMGHAIWLALQHRNDDLIELRRRFRVVFAAAVGAMGLAIAAGELMVGFDAPPTWLTQLHAFGLAALVFAFGVWLLKPRDVFGGALEPVDALSQKGPDLADQHDLDRLQALMESGVYREDGLTVAALAEKVGVPEHRLRKLINGALGYRNFSAFLNSWRIEEAKTLLADPAQARRQILQIALDLGYGSVASFNRAFKAGVGETPTAFRRAALGS